MPHCHEEPEAPPPSRFRAVEWREFLLVLVVLLAILTTASAAAYALSSSPPVVTLPAGATVYYNEACSDCAVYLRDELLPTLEAAGIEPVVVKDYINKPAYRQELRGLNDAMDIPFELQSHLATFVRNGRILVLEGHVPGSLILEASTLPPEIDRLLLHQDSMGEVTAYGAWAFAGQPQHYPLGTPLSVYASWWQDGGAGTTRASPALLPFVLGAGFVDGLNPCAFAVLLFFVSFLYVSRRPRREVGRIGTLYIVAVFLAYFLIGLGLLQAVMVSEDPHLIARVSGVLVAAIGAFVLLQPLLPRIPNPFHTPRAAWEQIRKWMTRGTVPSAAIAGFLVGLCTFPCSGGVYVAVLSLLAAQSTYLEGLGYLYLYNIAFVLPLVLVLAVVSNKTLARRAATWERGHADTIRRVSGAAMIFIGIATVLLL